MRTLVISDLHLGNRAGHDVLRRPVALAALLDALAGVDRLVLLGDVAELVSRHPRRQLAAAEPVLRTIGRRMGARAEIVLVPGNHDAPLIRAWIRAQDAGLALDATVDPEATRALARVLTWLGPARVRVRYPGVWLDERIYATHGHYLDHHLFPQSATGLPRGPGHGRPGHSRSPLDYERLRLGAAGGGSVARQALRNWVRPELSRLVASAKLQPIAASMLDLQMRHAAVPALGKALTRLGIEADWVVFGHVHRSGPLPGDRLSSWSVAGGTQLVNAGSWLYEPLLVQRASPPHPYWPGGAVVITPGEDPRPVNLLDGVDRSELRPEH